MIRSYLELHGWTCVRSDDEGDLYTKGNPVCANTEAALFTELLDRDKRTDALRHELAKALEARQRLDDYIAGCLV